jgi:hypothetical protein
MIGNKPVVATSPKIIIDDIEAKKMLMEIAAKKGDSMKGIFVQLVKEEHANVFGNDIKAD